MERWRVVLRKTMRHLLSVRHLEAFLNGLEVDDSKILQGATTTPPPLQCVQEWPCEAACGLGYCGWQGDGLETVAEVEEFFARLCFETDNCLGEPAGCRWFINWFDETPRDVVRRLVSEEIRSELAMRSIPVLN